MSKCFSCRQVTEFVEFGDIDMMLQYLKDVQAVQRKIAELTETIEFINEVCNKMFDANKPVHYSLL